MNSLLSHPYTQPVVMITQQTFQYYFEKTEKQRAPRDSDNSHSAPNCPKNEHTIRFDPQTKRGIDIAKTSNAKRTIEWSRCMILLTGKDMLGLVASLCIISNGNRTVLGYSFIIFQNKIIFAI